MKVKSKISSVYAYLPPRILSAVTAVPKSELDEVREIRLRLGRKLTLTAGSKEFFLHSDGTLTLSGETAIDITSGDIEYIYQLAMRNSLHSFQREITHGYITVQGGCRIGFCGTAVLDPNNQYKVENVKDISSVNIRIAREIIGCADEIYQNIFSQRPTSLLIAGPPSSGKTTLLRDLARQLGNICSVSIIDERNELAGTFDKRNNNDVGIKTDVFTSYNKYEGIMTAVKVMSPVYLLCDEIGSREDLKALEYAVNSGVNLVATCHAASIEELRKKPVIRKLIKLRAFDRIILLSQAGCSRIISDIELFKNRKEAALC